MNREMTNTERERANYTEYAYRGAKLRHDTLRGMLFLTYWNVQHKQHPHQAGAEYVALAAVREGDRWYSPSVGIVGLGNGVSLDEMISLFKTALDNRISSGNEESACSTSGTEEKR